MISLGKTVAMINPNVAPLVITGGFLEQIGWGVIGNLHILFEMCIRDSTMDKLIKTITESGSFRAYVLDSTETVRTAQEKHNTLSSSTVALGRTLIANQILAANQKGESKITVKVIGNSSFGHIISCLLYTSSSWFDC